MPFGSDANDLPLQDFQEDMNRGLRLGLEPCEIDVPRLLLVHPMTDHMVFTKSGAILDYQMLMQCVLPGSWCHYLHQSTEEQGV